MSSPSIDCEDDSDIPFSYEDSPHSQSFIRLLTLLPGTAWKGGGDPLGCLLTTHIWDPEIGFIHHMSGNATENLLVSQKTLNGELFSESIKQELKSLTDQCSGDKPCACLKYEALSYVWGKGEFRFRISLNGQKFKVTRSLQQALYHLRYSSAVRRLWVDAICIDQMSEDDKGRQVRQMDRIYLNAFQVVAWLGLPVKNSLLAFQFAEKLYETACLTPDLTRGTEGELYVKESQWLGKEQYLSIRSQYLESSYSNEWLALYWVFKNPYWQRAWIFQEAILAKQLCFVCGSKSMTWGVMEIAMQLVRVKDGAVVDLMDSSIPISGQNTVSPVIPGGRHPTFHALNFLRILAFLEGRRRRKFNSGAESPSKATELLLELIHLRSAKIQHDLIYSIMGLVPSSIAISMPVPGYEQLVTEVFKQFAKSFVVGAQSLNILCYSNHSDTQDDLPSWVFDWRRERRLQGMHDITGCIGTIAHRKWHTVALSKYIPTFSDDGTTISIAGLSYGTIMQTKLEHDLLPNIQMFAFDRPDKDEYGVSRCHHVSHEAQIWNFEEDARELLGDAPSDSPMLQDDAASTLLHMLSSIRAKDAISGSPNQNHAKWTKTNNFNEVYAEMRGMAKCRTTFVTNDADIGLAPMWAQPGDMVCQFFGCTAAFILRELDGRKYSFVGDCYVLGKMGWDAIKILESGEENNTIREFDLI